MKNGRYLVFRVYNKEERENIEERSVFYGWTRSINVLKAFLKQRTKSKYVVRKISGDEELKNFPLLFDGDEENVKINFVILTSVTTHEDVKFFLTIREMQDAEILIQRMFHDMSSLSNISGDGNYLELLLNLKEPYSDALAYLGYRPPDIDAIFPSSEDYSPINRVIDEIDDAYDSLMAFPDQSQKIVQARVPGLSNFQDVFNKILYSVESFIKVLKDDL